MRAGQKIHEKGGFDGTTKKLIYSEEFSRKFQTNS